MKVDNKDDRKESPEECDYCGWINVGLERFYYYGSGHNVNWLCGYCSCDFAQGESLQTKTIAAMMNLLEFRIERLLKKNDQS